MDSAAAWLQDQAARWSVSTASANEVVLAACDALVAGLDGPALRALAACERAEADVDVPVLLPPALEEQGLTFYAFGSPEASEAGVRLLAAHLLAGRLTPHELTSQVHQRFGHELELAEHLSWLDDEYDLLDHTGRTADEVDAEVIAEARRVLGE